MAERFLVLWNPGAGSADDAQPVHARLRGDPRFDVVPLDDPQEIRSRAADAAERGYAGLMAAGGDGTVNAAINGLAQSPRELPLIILPLGTGNDLARTLCLPDDPAEVLDLLESPVIARIDRVRVDVPGGQYRYVNMGSGGFSAAAVETTSGQSKRRWGFLAYFFGAAQAVREFQPYAAEVTLDDEPPIRTSVYNVILANGRTTSRGLQIAPQADPQDGRLDVLLILARGFLDLASLASEFVAGRHLDAEQLVYRQAGRVRINSQPQMSFSLDGDTIGSGPLEAVVEPQTVPVLVGPGYRSTPAASA